MPQNYSWFLNEEETKIDVFLLLFGGSAFPIKVTSFFIWCDINELFFFSWCYFYGPFCILNAINGRYVLIDRLPSERLIFPLSKGEKRGVLQQKSFENKEKFSILIALELIAVLFEMYLPCFCKNVTKNINLVFRCLLTYLLWRELFKPLTFLIKYITTAISRL